MTGIEAMVRLIIPEATGLVTLAHSVSYWFLNRMLPRSPFGMNSPWMMCENGSEGEIS